jgi:DNA-binding beta-propeller fold protein YncE
MMTTKMGSGELTYEVLLDWAKLPVGWSFLEAVDVAVDSKDRVYVFCRGEHPLIVFDPEGNFLDSWGEGQFKRPHGITMSPDGSLYCVDDGDHVVRKYTPGGKLLLTLGSPGQASPFQEGLPFNRPTKAAFDPKTGDLYVADGYGNSRVHKFSPDGKRLFSWGQPGSDPGEFNLVHSICTDKEGYVYVADRENHRVQIFDSQGRYMTQWNNMHRPCGLHISGNGEQKCYVGELAPSLMINENFPNLGPRISIYNLKGKRQARLGDIRPGEKPDQFWAPHGMATDSHGNLYVAEVSWSFTGSRLHPPRELNSFRKLVMVK